MIGGKKWSKVKYTNSERLPKVIFEDTNNQTW